MSFRALLVEKSEAGEVSANIREIDESQLPADGDVTVDVAYSTVNYKDGLCVNGLGGLVRNFPHVPGIDFAGTITRGTNKQGHISELYTNARKNKKQIINKLHKKINK